MLVKNLTQKGKTIVTSHGTFNFNAEGVTDIIPDEFAMKIIEVPGYVAVEDLPEVPTQDNVEESEAPETPQIDNVEDEVETTSDDEVEEEITQEEEVEEVNFDKMNVPQLKKYAKDNEIELNGAAKKDEIIAIILGAKKN